MQYAIILGACVALVVSSLAPLSSNELGNLEARRLPCRRQPSGTGPTITKPADDEESFMAYQSFPEQARNAVTPEGYQLEFQNLNASSQEDIYLDYKVLHSYDPAACAAFCEREPSCTAFNIYFERDPTLDPDLKKCPNPPSLTNIKCARWGDSIGKDNADNYGQPRAEFIVAIAGSNGYGRISSTTGDARPVTHVDTVQMGGSANSANRVPVSSSKSLFALIVSLAVVVS